MSNPGLTSFLIVDDDEFILDTTAYMLRRLGYELVLTATDVVNALDLINTSPIPVDMILCDLNMPGTDGVEFMRQLTERQYAGGILLISGEDSRTLKSAENLARAHGLQLVGAISKPVKTAELVKKLEEWGKRSTSPLSRTSEIAVDKESLKIAMERAEIVPVYQPKVELATGRCIGVEVLARWYSPSVGMIYPNTFIPVAEESGLIDDMTFLLVANAIRDSANWERGGLATKLAFNISMDSLQSLEFTDQLLETIAASSGRTENIVLEVTESRFMQSALHPLDALIRLRMKRIRLSIDDFGTGFSSLTQLKDLPFDELKIDRSFVNGAGRDEQARTILESSVAMGKKLNMTVVAEGIEDADDWQRVLDLGCDHAQGYYMGKPMLGAQLPVWIRQWNRHFH
jgi:EAL domain-containing protein (putative c-di-GMP-specific phosphodiesterase class I)/ActR/RegA family two-component response regulator